MPGTRRRRVGRGTGGFSLDRCEYNEIRPHEALDDQTPATVYEASTRPFPRRL